MNELASALRAELSRRPWAQADLARVLNWSVQTTSEVMQGKRRIDATMALDLAEVTNRSAFEWLELQNNVDLEEARRRYDGTDRRQLINARAQLEDRVPVRELIRRGVISNTVPDIQTVEVDELIGPDPTFGASAKRQIAETPFTRAQTAWIALARRKALEIPLPQFDEAGFGRYVGTLPTQVTEPEDFVPLPTQFATFGVALVHVDRFPGGRIDGVSLRIDDNPMVALSGRGRRFDKVLFALLHECAHVLAGHWREAPRLHEDGDEFAVGDTEVENSINALAASWCFPAGPPNQRPTSRQQVAAIASEHGVAESVVIGNMQHRRVIDWSSTLSRGLPTVEEELKLWP